MSKQTQDNPAREGPMIRRSSAGTPGMLGFATLAGVAILLFVSIQNWSQTRGIEQAMTDRLTQIETRLTQISAKVDSVATARPQQPARRGPDPNKVYPVKTEGRPYKGPKNAPVTIAEFSDFQ